MYQRAITPSAKRSLKKLPRQIREFLIRETSILEHNPRAGEKLSGALSFLHSFHCKRDGVEYRITYTIQEEKKLVIIHLAHTRENFYKKLRRSFN